MAEHQPSATKNLYLIRKRPGWEPDDVRLASDLRNLASDPAEIAELDRLGYDVYWIGTIDSRLVPVWWTLSNRILIREQAALESMKVSPSAPDPVTGGS